MWSEDLIASLLLLSLDQRGDQRFQRRHPLFQFGVPLAQFLDCGNKVWCDVIGIHLQVAIPTLLHAIGEDLLVFLGDEVVVGSVLNGGVLGAILVRIAELDRVELIDNLEGIPDILDVCLDPDIGVL